MKAEGEEPSRQEWRDSGRRAGACKQDTVDPRARGSDVFSRIALGCSLWQTVLVHTHMSKLGRVLWRWVFMYLQRVINAAFIQFQPKESHTAMSVGHSIIILDIL